MENLQNGFGSLISTLVTRLESETRPPDHVEVEGLLEKSYSQMTPGDALLLKKFVPALTDQLDHLVRDWQLHEKLKLLAKGEEVEISPAILPKVRIDPKIENAYSYDQETGDIILPPKR